MDLHERVAAAIFTGARDMVLRHLRPVKRRIAELEARPGVEGPPGPPGPQGVQGDVPRHRFIDNGTRVQFTQGPDGNTWGEPSADLSGPRGPAGRSGSGIVIGSGSASVTLVSYMPAFIENGTVNTY